MLLCSYYNSSVISGFRENAIGEMCDAKRVMQAWYTDSCHSHDNEYEFCFDRN